MNRKHELPAALLPVVMLWTFVRARAEKARSSEDLGALSLELVLIAVALFGAAVGLVAIIVNYIKGHEQKIQ